MNQYEWNEYRIANLIVRAKKSPGGGFYDVEFSEREKYRYLADVFETVATLVEKKNDKS